MHVTKIAPMLMLTNWNSHPLLEQVPLHVGSSNILHKKFAIKDNAPQLHIYPDGGVARLRVYGKPNPSWKVNEDDLRYQLVEGEVDLAAMRNGGQALLCSDMFFGVMSNRIAPQRARVMGEGWETRRSRRVGFDWIIVKLGTVGTVSSIVLDTNHFKGNFAHSAQVEGILNPDISLMEPRKRMDTHPSKSIFKEHFEHQYRNEIVEFRSVFTRSASYIPRWRCESDAGIWSSFHGKQIKQRG